MASRLPLAGLVLLASAASALGQALQLYVATNGRDAWSGRLASPNAGLTDGPKLTLEGARDQLRFLRTANAIPSAGAVVNVLPGIYARTRCFELSSADSGTSTGPIVYMSTARGGAILEGGVSVTSWQPAKVSPLYGQLPSASRDFSMYAPLAPLGVTDCGTIKHRRPGANYYTSAMELFYGDQPMTLAKYPNTGWAAAGAVGPLTFTDAGGKKIKSNGQTDMWYTGFPRYQYQDDWINISSYDDQTGTATLLDAPSSALLSGSRYRIVNVISELDMPGEYYIDRVAKAAYFYPPDNRKLRTVVSTLEAPIFGLWQASNVKIDGFVLQDGRGDGIVMNQCSNIQVYACTIRNMGRQGIILGATDSLIHACNVSNVGYGAIKANAGNRMTLAPGNVTLTNNDIWNTGRIVHAGAPAVSIMGVGNIFRHNRIRHVSSSAISFGGNEHLIESNEVGYAAEEVGDYAAVYGGADVTMRGNVIRGNLVHDVTSRQRPSTAQLEVRVGAIHFDDFLCGNTAEGNIIVRADIGILVGGGSDNTVRNNAFWRTGHALFVDARGLTFQPYAFNAGSSIMNALFAVPYNAPPYSIRYPTLPNILNDSPLVPKRNRLELNASQEGILWERDNYFSFTLNVIGANWGSLPTLFNNPAMWDFSIPSGNSVLAGGFQQVDASSMGLYIDSYRPSFTNDH